MKALVKKQRPLRIPPRFAQASMGTLDQAQMQCVFSYVANMSEHYREGRGLLLSGPPGVGKTWAIAAATRVFVEIPPTRAKIVDYEFVTAPDMFDNLGDFGEKHDGYRECLWMDTYVSVPWLVINDLGKEYRGGKLAEVAPYKLGRILRARSERSLITHVTTNLVGKELSETYGGSVFSLLKEMVSFNLIGGKDRRGVRV